MNEEVTVVAMSRAKPGREKDLEAALRACVAETHREAGCVRYALQRGADDPARFAVIEKWRSRAELEAHLKTAHVATLFAVAPDLVAEPPTITVFSQVGAGLPEKGRI